MRGLGRVLWAQEDQDPRHHAAGGRRRLRRRQRHHAALPLRIAAAAGSARERVPARRSRQEQRRPHHHRSRSGDQPDPARAVARSGARSDQEGKARRPIRNSIRRCGGTSVLQIVLGLFGIGRDPSTHVAGRAHARILLRPAQRLRGRKIARDRHRFRFGRSRACRPRRQRDRRDLPARCSRRRSRIRPAPPATGWPAKSPSCAPRWRTPKPRSRTIAPSPICSSAPTTPRCRTSSSPKSIRRSRRRAGRRRTWRRGRGNCASSSAPASRSSPPTSPIPNRCAG